MKTSALLFGLAMIGLVPFGLTGCQEKEEQSAAPAAVESKIEATAPAAEHPADAKPKDHPAH